MKFFRIFPEICARTWCLFSSSTRNIAFGRGSITVAMTSMASSLGNRSFPHSSCRHMTLHFFAVDQSHQLAGHFGRWRPAVNLVKASGVLVVLHKGIGLGAIV